MKNWTLAVAVVLMIVLHQDVWNWRTADPVVFGVLPIGLAYHAGYTLATAILMAVLIRFAWPAELERDAEEHAHPVTGAGDEPA